MKPGIQIMLCTYDLTVLLLLSNGNKRLFEIYIYISEPVLCRKKTFYSKLGRQSRVLV